MPPLTGIAESPLSGSDLALDGHEAATFDVDPSGERIAVTWYEEDPSAAERVIARWGYTVFARRSALVPIWRYVHTLAVPWAMRPSGPVFSRCGRLLLSAIPPVDDAMDGDAGHLVVHDVDGERIRRIRLHSREAPLGWTAEPGPAGLPRLVVSPTGSVVVPRADGRIARVRAEDLQPSWEAGEGRYMMSPSGRWAVKVQVLGGWWWINGGRPMEKPEMIGWWTAIDLDSGMSTSETLYAVVPPGLSPPPGDARDVPRPPVFQSEARCAIHLPTGDVVEVDLDAPRSWAPRRPVVGERTYPPSQGPEDPMSLKPAQLVDGIVPTWRHRYDIALSDTVVLRLAHRGPGPRRYHCVHVELELERGTDPPPGALSDLELAGCLVTGSDVEVRGSEPLGSATWVAARPVVTKLRLRETMWSGCILGVVFSDCVLDGVRRGKLGVVLGACGFRRVVLRGETSQLAIGDALPIRSPDEEKATLDVAAALGFYDDVDWALDLREASLTGLELAGIPPEKIRHDPVIHGILRRDEVAAVLRRADVRGTGVEWQARALAEGPYPSCLLMAHRRSKSFRRERELLAALRTAKLVR